MSSSGTMKAVVVKEPYKVVVEQRPIPKPQDAHDVVVKVELAALCGSDLHVYRGHQPTSYDFIMGHELVGHVHEVGEGVKTFKKGDYVVCPFTVSCGNCFYCTRSRTSRCESSKLLGCAVLDGAQAEYIRIPMGETSLFHAPTTVPKESLILMADIFPTGYFVSRNAYEMMNEAERQDTTAIVIGCGPVGLCAVTAATHFFKNVYAVDSVPERLAAARKHGAKDAWNFKEVDVPAKVKELTKGRGADAVLEVVGHLSALEMGVQIVRPWGIISSCGIHTHEVKLKGLDLYNKNIRFQFGRCPVRALFGDALEMLAQHGEMFKGFVENTVSIDEAEKWYELFEQNKCLKTAFKMS
ncbi:GroES-like protein [Jaminaea rosea]|uniref:GroES-like protein n=1 Tax=Jaminaea rosea TaxID=1569628 RepID=A0A316UWC4_9BASI|nr:GroES-like protein [Jaminaea rosea]PWN28621.1 GroES-like protein [Jaminaea rosea]